MEEPLPVVEAEYVQVLHDECQAPGEEEDGAVPVAGRGGELVHGKGDIGFQFSCVQEAGKKTP